MASHGFFYEGKGRLESVLLGEKSLKRSQK